MKAKKTKADLIVAMQDLLETQSIGTQEEISEHLQKKGFVINQVKISRLLNKLGAIKINEGSKVVYRLPTELRSITPDDPLKQLILKIVHNESLIVIQTAPGCAQFVARFLDQQKDLNILGTVAGDDTIFIAPTKTSEIKKYYQKIYQTLLGK